MFGINGGEFIVLVVVAVIVIGPERLPGYAAPAGVARRSAASVLLQDAKERVDDELGDEVKRRGLVSSTRASTTRAASCARR